jgi:hypothetical protein
MERGRLARNCSQSRSSATKLVVPAHHRILSCMFHLRAIAGKMPALHARASRALRALRAPSPPLQCSWGYEKPVFFANTEYLRG